ncbi:MAG: hypothetical protein WC552_08330 [Candidatus Omnitrophota bacterium]
MKMKEEILKLAEEIKSFAELTAPEGALTVLLTALRQTERHEEAKVINAKCADKWSEFSRRALAIAERL